MHAFIALLHIPPFTTRHLPMRNRELKIKYKWEYILIICICAIFVRQPERHMQIILNYLHVASLFPEYMHHRYIYMINIFECIYYIYIMSKNPDSSDAERIRKASNEMNFIRKKKNWTQRTLREQNKIVIVLYYIYSAMHLHSSGCAINKSMRFEMQQLLRRIYQKHVQAKRIKRLHMNMHMFEESYTLHIPISRIEGHIVY